MDDVEAKARAAVARAYGSEARITVDRSQTSGMIRVLDSSGKRLTGWYWDVTSLSQNTEAQAWHTVRLLAEDHERSLNAPRSAS